MQPTEPQLPPESATRVVPIIEEFVRVEKETVETGRVVIRKHVLVDTKTIDTPLHEEQINVRRIAVNRYVDEASAVRYEDGRHEGDTMTVPVLREELVVTKRLLLVEKLHVRKQVLNTNVPQTMELRRKEVHYERVATPTVPPAQP